MLSIWAQLLVPRLSTSIHVVRLDVHLQMILSVRGIATIRTRGRLHAGVPRIVPIGRAAVRRRVTAYSAEVQHVISLGAHSTFEKGLDAGRTSPCHRDRLSNTPKKKWTHVHDGSRTFTNRWKATSDLNLESAETPAPTLINYGQETTATSTSSAEHNGGLLSLQSRETESQPPHCFRVRRAVNGRLSPTHEGKTRDGSDTYDS